jgi:peroxiredoxin
MSTDAAPMARSSAFTAFWLYRSNRTHARATDVREQSVRELTSLIEESAPEVELRAAYSATGFVAGVDLILWVVATDLSCIQQLGARIGRSCAAGSLELKHAYIGAAAASQYDPNHGPAFLRGLPPKRYLSVYPFSKTPAWYLLPFEERRALMVEHGRMGAEYPTILTNTVNSFGIADQEFIVALEDDDPNNLIKMVQRLRSAAVRVYTQLDTPVFLGLRKPFPEALADAL